VTEDLPVPSAPVVAVLGTGTMGAGMARSLQRAGLPVRMWNRDPSKARALAGPGMDAFDSAAEAAAGADVVLTMLLDADAVIDTIRQAAPAPGTVWLQCATVGIEGAERTAAVAGELGVLLVDAPVLGTRKPAEEGQLVVLASGAEEARERLAPVLEAIGRKTLWLGAAGTGSRLKLVCNAWVFMLTAGVAQSVALAQGLGLDPRDFLAAIDGGPLNAPYAHVKSANAMAREYPVSFGLHGAMKDNRLIRAALASAGLSDRLTTAVLDTMEAAERRLSDGAEVDMIALIEGLPLEDR
jgi:3-hydroxyisobutyrate dehydrogenase